jgi:hypothetical protein
MIHTSRLVDPLTNSHVLRNLGLAIDEIELLRSIERIASQIESSNAGQMEQLRRYLISELRVVQKDCIRSAIRRPR